MAREPERMTLGWGGGAGDPSEFAPRPTVRPTEDDRRLRLECLRLAVSLDVEGGVLALARTFEAYLNEERDA